MGGGARQARAEFGIVDEPGQVGGGVGAPQGFIQGNGVGFVEAEQILLKGLGAGGQALFHGLLDAVHLTSLDQFLDVTGVEEDFTGGNALAVRFAH